MKNKNPFTASIINFFFWGLGYIYCGRKRLFGCLVFVGFFFVHLPLLYGQNRTEIPGIFISIGHLILSLAFAIDMLKPEKIKEKKADIVEAGPILTK